MLADGAQTSKDRVWLRPGFELQVHDLNEFVESREVAVVKPEFTQELPNALDGVELRTVRRKEKQSEVWLLQSAPLGVELSMVVPGVEIGRAHV